ncbi:MAG: enhanced intracellular survival protein Eis [Actinomycetes bacterium]
MTRRYRVARPEEHRALMVQDAQAFGDSTTSISIDRSVARTRVEELRVLEEGRTRLGLLLARNRPVFWGGRPVPASQVSGLSVGAEYRGRGVATDLLRNYLAEVHERGAAISTLFPAAVQLYRRAGYEYAGTCNLYEVAARHLPAGWPDGWRARSVPADDPAPLQERFARVAAGRSGQVDRDADWWRHFLLADRGSGPPQVFLVDGPGGPGGWAVMTVSNNLSASEVRTSVEVVDWGAAGEAAWRSLLTLAGGFSSLEATVHWKGPDPEPLALLLPEQDIRQLRQDRWMARVVDVPGAFAARGYPPWLRGRITIGVEDATCPWVDGTWTIEVDGGEGKAVRVGDDADLHTTAAGLAALFAGHLDPRDLATLGVVRGLDQAGVEFLQAMHAGPKPWSPDYY